MLFNFLDFSFQQICNNTWAIRKKNKQTNKQTNKHKKHVIQLNWTTNASTILLYGCESWVISKGMENKINAFGTSMSPRGSEWHARPTTSVSYGPGPYTAAGESL